MPLQFAVATLGADLGGGLHEQFGVGIGGDDGADVAAVEHCATGLAGEALLALEQRGADERMRRDDRGELADRILAQRGIVEQAFVEVAGGDSVGLDRRVQLHPLHGQRDRAVKQAGVEMRQAVMAGERLGDRALAARGGSVDGDDHALSHCGAAPRRVAVSTNSG